MHLYIIAEIDALSPSVIPQKGSNVELAQVLLLSSVLS